jgi:hypothetical protein
MKTIKTVSSIIIILFVISNISGCKSDERVQTNAPLENYNEIISAEFEYETFEKICADATDIVIARYVSHKPYGGADFTTEYEFTVKERISGNAPDIINVYDVPDNNGTVNMHIDGDTDYILVLNYVSRVQNDFDYYKAVMALNADKPSESEAFGEPISRFTDKFDFEKADRQSLIQYVSSLASENKPHVVCRTNDLSELVDLSTDIVRIKVKQAVRERIKDAFSDTELYYAEVLEPLKGTLKTGSVIKIVFRTGAVKENDEVFVLLDDYENSRILINLTGRDAVYGTERETEIKNILK